MCYRAFLHGHSHHRAQLLRSVTEQPHHPKVARRSSNTRTHSRVSSHSGAGGRAAALLLGAFAHRGQGAPTPSPHQQPFHDSLLPPSYPLLLTAIAIAVLAVGIAIGVCATALRLFRSMRTRLRRRRSGSPLAACHMRRGDIAARFACPVWLTIDTVQAMGRLHGAVANHWYMRMDPHLVDCMVCADLGVLAGGALTWGVALPIWARIEHDSRQPNLELRLHRPRSEPVLVASRDIEPNELLTLNHNGFYGYVNMLHPLDTDQRGFDLIAPPPPG